MQIKNKILVIDDDIALLKILEAFLTEYYEVSLAKSGKQAMRFLESNIIPNLILLDVDMPDMDGFETLNQLNNLNKEIPVIFLTGMINPDCELCGLQLGAVDYIKKPLNKEILLTRIKMHLANACQQYQLKLLKENQIGIGGLQPDKILIMKEKLTQTEFSVASLAAQGYSNNEIGQLLNYSPAYIKKIISRLFDRLDIHKRGEIRQFFINK